MLVGVSVTRLCLIISGDDRPADVEYVTASYFVAIYAISLTLHLLSMRHGVVTSALQFTFYLASVTCGGFTMRYVSIRFRFWKCQSMGREIYEEVYNVYCILDTPMAAKVMETPYPHSSSTSCNILAFALSSSSTRGPTRSQSTWTRESRGSKIPVLKLAPVSRRNYPSCGWSDCFGKGTRTRLK